MQKILSTLLVLLYASFSSAQLSVDGCLLTDLSDVEVERLITRDPALNPGEGSNPVVNVQQRFNNCFAVGRVRGRFRSKTETVRFTVQDTPTSPIVMRTAQLDFECVDDGSIAFWQVRGLSQNGFTFITDAQLIQTLTSGNFTMECAACINTGLDSNDDQTLHCDRCDAECLAEEQRLCYGSTNDRCCNVYVNSICMNECPTNFAASAESSFECVCALECLNSGTPLNDCSGCNCTEGFNGTLCETPIDPCDGVQCSGNGRCIPGVFPDFTCVCNAGFTGEMCEIELNQCEPNPCENNGTCVRLTFPAFECNCLDNFSGNRCENCDLTNCRTCSLTSGICLDCFDGFLLQDGLCLIDCSICDQREDQCQRNTCNFYCLLNSWSTEANACGLEVPMFTEPSNTLQKQEIFRRINDAASTAESAWTTEAAEVDSSLSSVEPPNRAGITLPDWIAATKTWLMNLDRWLEYIRSVNSDFSNFNITSLMDGLDDDPQGTYEAINTLWKEIVNEFTNRVALQRCRA